MGILRAEYIFIEKPTYKLRAPFYCVLILTLCNVVTSSKIHRLTNEEEPVCTRMPSDGEDTVLEHMAGSRQALRTADTSASEDRKAPMSGKTVSLAQPDRGDSGLYCHFPSRPSVWGLTKALRWERSEGASFIHITLE